MSGNGKRILPAGATTTSALIPMPSSGLHGTSVGRGTLNEDLIDQLVGGLVQTDQPGSHGSQTSDRDDGFGAQDRIYSIDDEEIDEPPVPIPSTWRDQGAHEEPSWIAEQLRASAYGFVIGLFVVIPAVLLLTGQAERLPTWQAVQDYARSASAEFGLGDLLASKTGSGDQTPAIASSAEAPRRDTAEPAASARVTDTARQAAAVVAPATQPASFQAPAAGTTAATDPAAGPRKDSAPPSGSALAAAGTAAPDGTVATNAASSSQTITPGSVGLQSNTPETANAGAANPVNAPRPPTTDLASQAASLASPAQQPASSTAPAKAAPDAATSPGTSTASQGNTSADTQSAASGTVANGTVVAGLTPPAGQTTQPQAGSSADATAKGETGDVSLWAASQLVASGDMDGARVMLAKLASQGNSTAVFALAETFDPNVLAAWGTSGAEANAEKARMFYSMALAQGVAEAKGRLKALE